MVAEEKGAVDEAVRLKIEQRAYEIWQREGSPHGCDVDHWLRAEAEITSSQCQAPAADAATEPAAAKGKNEK
jgi:hypothetical protein